MATFLMAGIQNQGIIRTASFWRLIKNCSMLLSWLLGAASNLWHFLADIIPISVSMALPFCVSISNLLLLTLNKDTSHWVRVHPNLVWPPHNFLTSTKTPLQLFFRGLCFGSQREKKLHTLGDVHKKPSVSCFLGNHGWPKISWKFLSRF